MSKRVLAVDSSKSLAALYQLQLQQAGFEASCCHSVNDCLAIIDAELPDLVLSSVELSDGSGIELCERLKRNVKTVLVPVVLISAGDSAELKTAAFAAGASDFILRSSNISFLLERVKSVLFHHATIPYECRHQSEHFTILVAEDSPSQRMLYRELITPMGYRLIECEDGEQAWQYMLKHRDGVDMVIADLHMPVINGSELCQLIRANGCFDQVPIVIITGTSDRDTLVQLLQRGVSDYLVKPFHSEEFIARLRVHLRNRLLFKEQQSLQGELAQFNSNLELEIRRRTEDLQEANISTIYKLAVACDYKDQNTAYHINRVRCYVEELALAVGVAPELSREMSYSSMMHDVGKIAIPDHVLNKNGRLDDGEWSLMQTHTTKGAEILGDKSFFKIAREIALSHHEKFDGSGYPEGLIGSDIPLSARLIAVVDVYDALTSARSYKQAWAVDDALTELQSLAGNHLDPELVMAFVTLQASGSLAYIPEQYPVDEAIKSQRAMSLQ